MNPKVSVVIPIYNTGKYIERCARSLFEQTLSDIEYIFVNDCSTDNSIEVLNNVIKEYPHLNNQIKIINHKQNCGLAGARITGLANATGEYIIQCDSDDWLDLDAYRSLYYTAKESDADVIIFGIMCEYNGYSKKLETPTFSDDHDIFALSLSGQLHNSLANKLIKRSLFEKYHITWKNGVNMLEDSSVTPKILYFAKKVVFVNEPYYHYDQQNITSYTHYWKQSNFDNVIEVCGILKSFLIENNIYDFYQKEFSWFLLNSKIMMLNYCERFKYRKYLCGLFNDIKISHLLSSPIIFRYKFILFFSLIGLPTTTNIIVELRLKLKQLKSFS